MKRASNITAVEFAVLALESASVLLLPSAHVGVQDFFWFVLCLAVLKFSDVWLPRGDTLGMSAALALGALFLFDARVVLAVLIMAEILALLPRGRGSKWRLALGSLAAEVVSTVACSALLIPLHLHPSTGLLTYARTRLLPEQYAYVMLVGVLFTTLEFALLQVESAFRDRRPVVASILGSLSYGGWLIAAQVSAGVLAALTYRTMGGWGLVVTVVMILVMRQSFVLLLEVRQAYDSTIGVLIRAMEAQSPAREGVAAQNADLCMTAGKALGMHGRELERIRYAALLLGLGSEELAESETAIASSSIIEGVEFLADVKPILKVCDLPQEAQGIHRSDLVCAYVVASAGVVNQVYPVNKLEKLRERVSPRIIKEIDAVFDSLSVPGQAETAAGGSICQ